MALFEPRLSPLTTVSRAAILLCLSIMAVYLWTLRLLPALGTDSLIYHLPLPVVWINEGFLRVPDLPFHADVGAHSPLLGEVCIYFLMRLHEQLPFSLREILRTAFFKPVALSLLASLTIYLIDIYMPESIIPDGRLGSLTILAIYFFVFGIIYFIGVARLRVLDLYDLELIGRYMPFILRMPIRLGERIC